MKGAVQVPGQMQHVQMKPDARAAVHVPDQMQQMGDEA